MLRVVALRKKEIGMIENLHPQYSFSTTVQTDLGNCVTKYKMRALTKCLQANSL